MLPFRRSARHERAALLATGLVLAAAGAALVPVPVLGQAPRQLDPVVLQLRWEYEFQFAGFVAAKELGYYAQAGLDVELRQADFDTDVYEELTSGRAQYAVGTTDALVARARGVPVVALAAIFQHSPFVLISREDSRILSPEDLLGRRVSVYSTRNTILEAMLEAEGLDPAQVDFVPYDPDYRRFISGEVPSTGAVVTLQPYVFERLGIPYSIMYPQAYGIDFYGNTLVALESEIDAHPQRVRAFREASLRGWEYALEHPQELIDILLDRYAPQLDRGVTEFEAEATRGLMQPDLITVGHMNPGRWEHIADVYRTLGIIDGEVAIEDFLYEPNPIQDNAALWRLIGALAILTLGVSAIAGTLYTFNARLKRAQAETEEKVRELEAALSEIRTLQDLLPICASCKKIRNDGGFWENVEIYITRHTDTIFSHGLCPDCAERMFPGFTEE